MVNNLLHYYSWILQNNLLHKVVPGIFLYRMDKYILCHLDKKANMIGVEIGVDKGVHAYNLLKFFPNLELYLIDNYAGSFAPSKLIAQKRLKHFNNRIYWLIGDSEKVVDDVPNDVDFVYYDADPSYKGIKQNISLYYNKVRTGGIFGGHDFSANWYGATKAILEFIDDNNLTIHGIGNDWWVNK